MSKRKRDPSNGGSTWVLPLQVLLLLTIQSTLATPHCDSNEADCRERRILTASSSSSRQPYHLEQLLYHPDQNDLLMPYDDEDESPEMNLKMWAAIAESLRQWQERKEEKAKALAVESQVATTNQTTLSSTKKSRRRRDEESVCYGRKEFCFKDKGPFDYLDTLPASPESIGTTFKLYTNANRPEAVKETGQFLDYDNATSLLLSHFNASNDVKIIIHGFGSSSRRPWVLNITKALLDLDNFNVINVDWENGAKMPNYVQAAANTQLVGKQIAELIRLINYYSKLTPSRYHLIGFSLGAHVAGFTGMEFRNPNISRITGLDPAAPLFEGYDAGVRLDESDATFVDVIHSNGDGFIRGGLGSYTPMGTVDFYPNGGRVQAGCNSVLMGALSDIISGKWNSLCNHRRAFRLFLDSLRRSTNSNYCTFRAFACPSYEEYLKGECFSCGLDGRRCADMGYFAHLSKARGKMYLITRQGSEEPAALSTLCGNQFRVRLDSSRDGQQGVTWGRVDITLINALNGLNETFTITSGESDEVKEGQRLQSLIVAHSELTNVTEVVLGYTKYKGWIYNGRSEWAIDRVEIQDSSGLIKSYCHPRTKLLNTFSLRVPLSYGNCSLSQLESSSSSSPIGGTSPFPGRPISSPGYTGLMKPPSLPDRIKAGGEAVGHGENDIDSGSAAGTSSSMENTWGVIVRKYGDFFSLEDGGPQSQVLGDGKTNSSQVSSTATLDDNQLTSGGGGGGAQPVHSGEQNLAAVELLNGSNSESTTNGEELPPGRLKPTPASVAEYINGVGLQQEEQSSGNGLLMRSAESSSSSSSPRSSRGILAAVPQVFSPTVSRTEVPSSASQVSQGDSGGITRWTRASTYLRNRTAALFNRLWTHHSPVVVVQSATRVQSATSPVPPQLPPAPPSPTPTSQLNGGYGVVSTGPLAIEPDGMNILTDYSTLAYYILSNPNTAIVTDHHGSSAAGKFSSN